MKTISDYTIYCTEEQTKRAMNLGANMKFLNCDETKEYKHFYRHHIAFAFPTAEQIVGWLEKQGILVLTEPSQDKFYGTYSLKREDGYWFNRIFLEGLYPSRKEATLAAIDAALKYLENVKQQ